MRHVIMSAMKRLLALAWPLLSLGGGACAQGTAGPPSVGDWQSGTSDVVVATDKNIADDDSVGGTGVGQPTHGGTETGMGGAAGASPSGQQSEGAGGTGPSGDTPDPGGTGGGSGAEGGGGATDVVDGTGGTSPLGTGGTDGVGSSSCDGTTDCNTCASCAGSDMCAEPYDACAGSFDCLDYIDCVSYCEDSDDACMLACGSVNPAGESEWFALAICIVCEACPTDCGAADAGCY